MNPPFSNSAWQSYDFSFRRDAHHLLAWGYRGALPSIYCNCEEDDITSFIADAIEDILNDDLTPKRFDRYSIKPQNPVRGEKRFGKKRRKLDILIERVARPRIVYIFEAKRLEKKNHRIKGYLGEEGLERFVSGKTYAAGLPEAAMVAYVQDRSVANWEAELIEALSEAQVEKRSAVKELKSCLVSHHLRANNSTLEIHHILLDCTAEPTG